MDSVSPTPSTARVYKPTTTVDSLGGMPFTWADLQVVGIAFDIAGALILAWSFSAKTPWKIREEIPRSVAAATTPGSITIAFPQGLARSMARQRAEARLGVALLICGFLIQAAYFFFPHQATLHDRSERGVCLGLALIPLAITIVGMKI
jgi:hypothetical protein